MSPGEHEELRRQVEEFVFNGYIRKIMSMYAQPCRPLDLMPLLVSGSVPKKVQNFVEGLPYHGDSSDDDLVGNSRMNFVYPWGNDKGPNSIFVISFFHYISWYQESKFLIKMFPRRSEDEDSEYLFFEGDGSSSDEWKDYGMSGEDYEGPPVFDDDQYEEELMPVYDTAIEDVIEEEEGFGGEEDNIEDVVVVVNDLCSLMIQTFINVDFSITVNSNPHELIWLQKGNLVVINILIGIKYQGYVKAKPMDDKFDFKMIKVRG
nr:hypothetical protein [Tanacetum cinerariifolium]